MSRTSQNKDVRRSESLHTSNETSESSEFGSGYDLLDDIPSLDMLDELEETYVTVNTRSGRLLDRFRQ